MCERGRRAGAPFYAPPRKTSAEIISEARAAISADMSGPPAALAGVRPLRTRRPFTPREPQRLRDTRSPSAFDLKYVSLLENGEESLTAIGTLDEQHEEANGTLTDTLSNRKKSTSRPVRTTQGGDGWSGFPKLPHLSGRSKPLHRRNTTEKTADELAQSISVIRPLSTCNGPDSSKSQVLDAKIISKTIGPEISSKKKLCHIEKSVSYDSATGPGDVTVRHLAVQLPTATTNDDYYNMTVLEIAEVLSQGSRDVDRTLLQLSALQKCIERSPPTDSLRDLVLRALLTHAHSKDQRLLAAVAAALLTMRVTGSHLTVACKLVFKIASDDKNDHLFKNGNLLELVVEGSARACPVRESGSALRAAGALRVLALEPALRTRARAAGAAHLAALHLKILNDAKAERPRQMTDEATHTLYQLTGALRNLAGSGEDEEDEKAIAEVFLESGAVGELVKALTLHTDRDVLTNVARCLSVVSASATCLPALCARAGAARALLGALCACASRAPLAVRLAYTLGNMAADNERARIDIYNEEGSVDVLLTVLELYTQRNENDLRDPDPDLHLVGSDLGGSDASNEDVLIKTVRVLANLCLEEAAGRGLATHAERTVRALLSCLELAEKGARTKPAEKEHSSLLEWCEELAVAALATINNITFYFEPSISTSHFVILEQLVKATCSCLSAGRPASLEALRALGNLTRCERTARAAVLHGVLDALPPYYMHEDAEVRSAAAGVLVNVCGAGGGAGEGTGGAGGAGGAAAVQALVAAARAHDVSAAALLSRALWNAHTHRPLEAQDARRVAAALAVFMDDEPSFPAYEAKCGGRRASDPEILKNHQVTFALDDTSFRRETGEDYLDSKLSVRASSVEEDLYLEQEYDNEGERRPGSDLGFEEGAPSPAWRALVAVALPLLERLRPARRDAAVGTD